MTSFFTILVLSGTPKSPVPPLLLLDVFLPLLYSRLGYTIHFYTLLRTAAIEIAIHHCHYLALIGLFALLFGG
jgi:hypothetical protein